MKSVRSSPYRLSSIHASASLAYVLFFLLIAVAPFSLAAQNIPIDSFQEEQMRLHQLLYGTGQTSHSVRPVWVGLYRSTMENSNGNYGIWSESFLGSQKSLSSEYDISMGFYQPISRFTINSSHPYGFNNEAAWYGRGVNSELFFGAWITSRFFTVTFRPQFTHHQNLNFEIPRFIEFDDQGSFLYSGKRDGSFIDYPFRFGLDPFYQYSHGYSSLRVHFKSVETGFSTEPIAWGNNRYFPLLFSHQAPGMNHFFLRSRAPVGLGPLGKLEWNYLIAFPEDSDFFRPEEQDVRKRLINAVNVVYSPSFIRNFHAGFSRSVMTYMDEQEGIRFSDFGLVLDPFFLENFIQTRGPLEQVSPRKHQSSLFFRWIWEKSNIEIYGEFYREDFAWDSRDLLMQPRHNSGYAFGFDKLFYAPLALFYRVQVEIVNMTPSFLQEVRPQNDFYTDPVILQGHTHRGHLLGAGIGPGSNAQIFTLDAYKEWGKYGIFLRRIAPNNHFHYTFDRNLNRPAQFRQGFGDYWRNRTDLTIGFHFHYRYERFLWSGNASWTKLFNYGRYDYGRFGGLNISNFSPYDSVNIQLGFSLSYLF